VKKEFDVERLAPMQLLDVGTSESVNGRLGDYEPRGLTPLYLALRRAFNEDAPAVKPEDDYWVILITDGLNAVGDNGGNGVTKAGVKKSIDEVTFGGKKEAWAKGNFEYTLKPGANDLGTVVIGADKFKNQ
ncbi:MAG: hypothetical protein ACK5AM_03150, partial [Pirellulaceae bacterium]